MTSEHPQADDASHLRKRILAAAARLLVDGDAGAITTRSVAAAASVQAPTLYRLFGEKRGLLDAVAEHVLANFMREKARKPRDADPVRDLADGWDDYIAFGVANPAVFAIMSETGREPSPAMRAGLAILRERMQRIARAGGLRVPVERAIALVHATGTGVISSQLALEPAARDPLLSHAARAAVFTAILTDRADRTVTRVPALAIALRAHLDAPTSLSPGERLLLAELLDRLATEPDARDARPPTARARVAKRPPA